jgi:hypothetical protein
VKQRKRSGFTIFEGDGSAWDTTCTHQLREFTENPVIRHIAKCIMIFTEQPDAWTEAHTNACTRPELKLVYTKGVEKYQLEDKVWKKTIAAIRRSGHRGTSCLNWWTNFVCWMSAVFDEHSCCKFLSSDARWGTDVTGVNRWLVCAFEGDDSILMTSPAIEDGSALHQQILQFWDRLGFNMEIHMRSKNALFVGYRLAIGEEGLVPGCHVPEIDRCFGGAGISTSASTAKAFEDDDKEAALALAASGALSRSYEYAGLVPSISYKFLNYAQECRDAAGRIAQTHDMKMRLGTSTEDLEKDVDIGAMADRIRYMNDTMTAVEGDEIGSFIPNDLSPDRR